MYENFKLCETLVPGQICLVVEKYSEGKITRKFHEHLPRHRLSQDSLRELLRALVIHHSGASADTIVGHYLNSKGRTPSSRSLPVRPKYAEPGVLRWYMGGDVVAWADRVISKSEFRAKGSIPAA